MTGIKSKDMLVSDMDVLIQRHEKVLVTVLCMVTAVRVLFFSAAFPFFNNVDEPLHFDMVHKYARGYLPQKGNDPYDRDSALLMVVYGTPEYSRKERDFPDGKMPDPVWRDPANRSSRWVAEQTARWQTLVNHNTFDPPVYYVLAGLWYDIGKLLGMQGGDLLYWVRFMNAPVCVALVCLGHCFARKFFPEKPQLWLGASLLVAFFPQDVFYSINSDVLSPLLSGASLYLLLNIYFEEKGFLFHAFTGIVVAATLLSKLSNMVLAPFVGFFFVMRFSRSNRSMRVGREIRRWLLLLLTSGTPVMLWLGWNHFMAGDVLGTTVKIHALGWTAKPVQDWWSHPVFTPAGMGTFVSELTRSFWRGEFAWGLQPIASQGMDAFYTASSLLLFPLSMMSLLVRRKGDQSMGRFIGAICVGVVLMYTAFLVWISIRFDYGDSWYPSRDHPYFSSGRLMLGALIPFVLLYVRGIDLLTSRFYKYVQPVAVVALMVVFITCNEVMISWKVFGSLYNWFHL